MDWAGTHFAVFALGLRGGRAVAVGGVLRFGRAWARFIRFLRFRAFNLSKADAFAAGCFCGRTRLAVAIFFSVSNC